jgi:cytoskeletal protein CcmA (bactofilin family)
MFSDLLKKSADAPAPAAPEKSTPPRTKEPMDTSRSSKSTNAALISEDVEFKGTLCFASSLELNGRFEGEIIAEGPLVIGESAVVKANIKAESTVIVRGKLQGNIEAKDKVEIATRAHVYGDVVAPKFSLSEGAVFVGASRTNEKSTPPSEFSNLFTRLNKPAAKAPNSSS